MTRQSLSAWCLVIGAAWLAPAGAAGQTQAAAPDGWTASRTAWGDPDLQGVWSFATITPLERPERYAGRDRLTDTEITTLNQDALTRGDEPPQQAARPLPGGPSGNGRWRGGRRARPGRACLGRHRRGEHAPGGGVGGARRAPRRAVGPGAPLPLPVAGAAGPGGARRRRGDGRRALRPLPVAGTRFRRAVRQFFVPAILADERMAADVLPDVPRFRFVDEESAYVAGRAAIPLTVLGGLVALVIAGAGVGLGRVRGAD